MSEQLLEEFYNKKFYFSYSSMKRLLYSPKSFYDYYILGNKEEKISKNLLLGKLIHCLLLEPNNFDKKFIVAPIDLPGTKNFELINNLYVQQKDNITELSTLRDFKDEILKILTEINFYQSLVDGKKEGELTGDEKRLEKVCTEQNETYFQFLCKSQGKNIIDQEQYNYAVNAVSVITTNNSITKIMYLYSTEFDNVEIFSEKDVKFENEEYPFGLKGIIDRFIIDHDKKTITLIDFKTTSKGLSNFKETVNFYNYDIQIAIYLTILSREYKKLNYKFKVYFIVIDEFFNEYAFEVKESYLSKIFEKLTKWLDICNYHYVNRRYRLPYKFDLEMEVLE